MLLTFNVEKQFIMRTDTEKVVTNSMNYLYACFTFSDEWTGEKTAVFTAQKKTYNALLDENNTCLVPWEVLTGSIFTVSVFCGDLITANKVIIYTIPSGYEIGDESRIPTPEIYTQVIERLNEIEQEIDPEAIQQIVDTYLADKDFVTEADVEIIVIQYITEHVHGVPAGGTTGQILVKSSNTDYDTEWADGNSKGINANPSIALRPTVIFSFDEANAYDSRFTILEDNGFHGAFSIRSSSAATKWDVWRSLIDAGHEWNLYSGDVGQTKPANDASVDTWYNYIKPAIDYAANHGMYCPVFYSASGHQCTGNQRTAAEKCGIKYIRAGAIDPNNTLNPDSSWQYPSKSSFNTQFKTYMRPLLLNAGVSTDKMEVDNAIAGGYSICFFMHTYTTDNFTEAQFREVVEYVKAKVDAGVLDCLTPKQYYDRYRHEYDFQQSLILINELANS